MRITANSPQPPLPYKCPFHELVNGDFFIGCLSGDLFVKVAGAGDVENVWNYHGNCFETFTYNFDVIPVKHISIAVPPGVTNFRTPPR
jgi:hypothetical protein